MEDSVLIMPGGKRILFRLGGKFYQISQPKLRKLLGLPPGPAGLGITIDGNHFHFEFARDNQTAELTAAQLKRRLDRYSIATEAPIRVDRKPLRI
jgi:hypothetical protein